MTTGMMLMFPYESIKPNQRTRRTSSTVSDKVKDQVISPTSTKGFTMSPESGTQSPLTQLQKTHPKLKRVIMNASPTSVDSGFQDNTISEEVCSQHDSKDRVSHHDNNDTQSLDDSSLSESIEIVNAPKDRKLKLDLELGPPEEIDDGDEEEVLEPISPYCNGSISFPHIQRKSSTADELRKSSITDIPRKLSTAIVNDKKTQMKLDLADENDLHIDKPMKKVASEPMFHSAYSNGMTPGSSTKTPLSDMSLESPFGSPPAYAQIRHFAQSPMVQFRHMPIVKNPYMSPFLAREDLLQNLPPTYFIVSATFTIFPHTMLSLISATL